MDQEEWSRAFMIRLKDKKTERLFGLNPSDLVSPPCVLVLSLDLQLLVPEVHHPAGDLRRRLLHPDRVLPARWEAETPETRVPPEGTTRLSGGTAGRSEGTRTVQVPRVPPGGSRDPPLRRRALWDLIIMGNLCILSSPCLRRWFMTPVFLSLCLSLSPFSLALRWGGGRICLHPHPTHPHHSFCAHLEQELVSGGWYQCIQVHKQIFFKYFIKFYNIFCNFIKCEKQTSDKQNTRMSTNRCFQV